MPLAGCRVFGRSAVGRCRPGEACILERAGPRRPKNPRPQRSTRSGRLTLLHAQASRMSTYHCLLRPMSVITTRASSTTGLRTPKVSPSTSGSPRFPGSGYGRQALSVKRMCARVCGKCSHPGLKVRATSLASMISRASRDGAAEKSMGQGITFGTYGVRINAAAAEVRASASTCRYAPRRL